MSTQIRITLASLAGATLFAFGIVALIICPRNRRGDQIYPVARFRRPFSSTQHRPYRLLICRLAAKLVAMSWTRLDYNPQPKRSDLRGLRMNGVRDVLVYCGNAPKCYHQARLCADRWDDDAIFGDLERRMVSTECGHRGADMRPAWDN